MDEKKVIPKAGVIRIVCVLIKNGKLRRCVYGLFGAILKDFFLPQFTNATGLTRRSEIYVDHPLDQEVPFSPRYVKIYLSFIRYCVDAVVYLYDRGGPCSVAAVESFVDKLTDLNKIAGSVYRTAHSTTQRPKYLKHPKFVMIHLFDPHLNCIPSLHVIVACHAMNELSQLADSLKLKDAAVIKQELENGAVEIVESVLLIKQHSINCVAAGLFCLSSVYSSFSENDALSFVKKLFTRLEKDLPARFSIRNEITALYCDFMKRFDQIGDTRVVLAEFLTAYDRSVLPDGGSEVGVY